MDNSARQVAQGLNPATFGASHDQPRRNSSLAPRARLRGSWAIAFGCGRDGGDVARLVCASQSVAGFAAARTGSVTVRSRPRRNRRRAATVLGGFRSSRIEGNGEALVGAPDARLRNPSHFDALLALRREASFLHDDHLIWLGAHDSIHDAAGPMHL